MKRGRAGASAKGRDTARQQGQGGMVPDISESEFERSIEAALLGEGAEADGEHVARDREAPYEAGGLRGYQRRTTDEYDPALCLIPTDVIAFLYATQPKEWERFRALHGGEAKGRLLKRLAAQVGQRGTLAVLRKGIKCDGCHFQLAYFRPSSGLNVELRKRYQANLFAAVRQLHYSARTAQSLDLALFLNGLPLFTAELKNPLTGQTVQDAVQQYRIDRDPREPLFAFRRGLAHFALDPDLAYMTTKLKGQATRFLPFNQGRFGGAGNPPNAMDYATAYLWREVWAPDSVLDLLQQFVQEVEDEDDKGNKTGEVSLVFPRYHQLDSVRRLVGDAREKGPGQRYLIQHSAGSGKTFSISWLAHQLAALHDAQDRRVFDSIIVVTDRVVLDRQLQTAVRQFEQVSGVVENIDRTSRQLKQALEDGKTIIVTTLQKFPVISKDMKELRGKRFAVIVDEAHSSQTGESTKDLKSVLAARSLEEATEADVETGLDTEDRVNQEMRERGPLPNVSYFAFTATPKAETMQLFGTAQPDGSYAPFSLYSMRQAIEEHFILDVLENYTTFKTYWNLLKTVEDDPRYERRKAAALLKSFVELHEHAIETKVQICMDHFVNQVQPRIGGKAKAMLVTSSRLHAVRYKLAVDRYIREKGYPFKALVAFSGTVEDGVDKYTEAGMNGFPETQTAEAFKRDEYRWMICAFKFQTGFDQPLLHTMYVDKKLQGLHAVQTLSRLNRTHPGKEETMVLDLVNDVATIQEGFQPYYDRTILTEGTDPNVLYDLQSMLEDSGLYTTQDVERFADAYFNPKATQARLYAALQPTVDRFKASEKEAQVEFRGTLREYVRLYAFLSQILRFVDADLEKLYAFGRLLLRKLPVSKEQLPLEIQQQVDMDSYRVQETGSGKIPLKRGPGELEPVGAGLVVAPPPNEVERLSEIIRELNERFGTDFTEADKVFLQDLEARLAGDPALAASVQVNTRDNARLTFDHVATDKVQDMIDMNFKFYKQITDDAEFGKQLYDWLFERYVKRVEK